MNRINRSSDFTSTGRSDSIELSTAPAHERESLDRDLDELVTVIKRQVFRKYRIERTLPQILCDLQELKTINPAAHDTLQLAIQNYGQSFEYIGKLRGVSKQAVHKTIHRAAARYGWVESLLANWPAAPVATVPQAADGGEEEQAGRVSEGGRRRSEKVLPRAFQGRRHATDLIALTDFLSSTVW